MKRRGFLKTVAGGAAALCVPLSASARPNREPIPTAVGMLYDSTLCVGCKACVRACKVVNGMPPVLEEDKLQYDSARDLSPRTLNVIKVYRQGTAERKDVELNGYCFEKRSCMHCVDPGCVSVCPVTALYKHPVTGIVEYDTDACIGCRNCMAGCPYNVPKYEYDDPFGQIRKCQLCNQAGVKRIDQGRLPACVEVCPTGATLFGRRNQLLAEARRRLAATPGEPFTYPRGRVDDTQHTHVKPAPTYQQHIYGEKEAGGTQVLHIAAVPLHKLGLPDLPGRSYASIAEGVQHTLYQGMVLPAVALVGLMWAVRRNRSEWEGGSSADERSEEP